MTNKEWIDKKLQFIEKYKVAQNAASGSEVDANANVTAKNIATLQSEIVKDDMIQINRAVMEKYLTPLYGEDVVKQFEKDLKNHYIYSHDETGLAPYCVAVSLYPFLLNGLKDLGGSSLPPKHADSYIGGMINLIFLLAGQYLGACMYKDQKVFIKKDGKAYSITSKDLYNLIEGNETVFNTLTDQWKYKTVKDIEIYENGKWVKLNKVLRRPYSDDIYNVKTKTGLSVFTSKDHKFKLYEKNDYTLKAEELNIGDKICADVNLFEDHKQIEFDEIVEIDKFVNDDEYVYEVETETHWYNCGGLITHNCAVPEFLPYFDHFLRVDFGDDYIEHLDESVITYGKRKETLRDRIEDWFQQFVYSINQPAGSRNYQSPFVNISYYDKGYFESIFNGFVFPDGDEPKWKQQKNYKKCLLSGLIKKEQRQF